MTHTDTAPTTRGFPSENKDYWDFSFYFSFSIILSACDKVNFVNEVKDNVVSDTVFVTDDITIQETGDSAVRSHLCDVFDTRYLRDLGLSQFIDSSKPDKRLWQGGVVNQSSAFTCS